jgi:uncharacterized protein (UPF0371 family)
MFKIGFDAEKYAQLQSQKIRDRIDQFGGITSMCHSGQPKD